MCPELGFVGGFHLINPAKQPGEFAPLQLVNQG
jgi:hypothetical protein